MAETSEKIPGENIPVITDNILKRQTVAGTVVDGIRQTDLTEPERKTIIGINVPDSELSDEDKALLKRQGSAGIEGNPPLTPKERERIAEIILKISPRR